MNQLPRVCHARRWRRYAFREWGHNDPGGSLEAWTAGLARQADADQVPGTLIALANRVPVAVVCLVGQDMPGYEPTAGLTPWIKGLFVIPSARRKGVGGLLVRRCEAWAASLGHQALYLYTERGSGAQALYERLGWRAVHAGRYDGIAITVMRASLTPAASQWHTARISARSRQSRTAKPLVNDLWKPP